VFKQKSDSASPAAAPTDAVQQARSRARQRLIGATVLLAIGIIGFPLVFETQPRPIPVDIPIEIPKREAMPPLVAPPSGGTSAATVTATPPTAARPRPAPAAPKPDAEVITESRADAGRDVDAPRGAPTSPPAAASASPRVAAASAPARAAASAPAPATEPRRVAAAASTAAAPPKPAASADGDRARALLEGRPVAGASAAETPRFVKEVQWSMGDVIIWDNRFLGHTSGRNEGLEEETMMYRITLQDGMPLCASQINSKVAA